jgi:PAS domain S-box-containing protein
MFDSRKVVFAAWALLVIKTAVVCLNWSPWLGGVSETLIGVLVVVAFIQAAQGTDGFGRKYWSLLSLAFVAWIAAHVPIVYQRDVIGTNVGANYWSVIILFFVFAVPFGAVLFLDPNRVPRKIHWQELLDFGQLGILVLAVFLAFAYIPFLQDPSRRVIIEKSLIWHLIRDGVLLFAFAGRALFGPTERSRYLFRRITIYLCFYVAAAALYFYGQQNWTGIAQRLTDVGSDLVRVIAITLAATSREPEAIEISVEDKEPASWTLWVQLVFFPMLVLFMLPRIAAESVFVAAMIVTVSVACLCWRLYVTQTSARRSAEAHRQSERHFRRLAQSISEGIGQTLFESLVVHGAEAASSTFALVGELKPDDSRAIRTIAVCKGNEVLPNFTYSLSGTPCESVIGTQLCHFPNKVAELFPEDKLLAQMNVAAYIGAPLLRSTGEPLGIFALLSETPFADPVLSKSVVQICASRAAMELERELDAASLRDSEHKLAVAFQLSPSPMLFGAWGKFSTVVDGEPFDAYLRMLSVSDSLVEFYGRTRDQIVGRSLRDLGVVIGANSVGSTLPAIIERERKFKDVELVVTNGRGELRYILGSGQLFEIAGEDYLLATFRDVTFERSARRQLEESEKKYRVLFENADDFIFTIDFDGKFLTVNRVGRKLCGISQEEVQSHSLQEILNDTSKLELQRHLDAVIRNEQSDVFEVKLAHPKAVSALEVSLQLITEEGASTFVQGIGRDITERKLLEKKILQSQRLEAVGTFAAGVAHDFNNLLTVIGGYSDLALAERGCTAAIKEELDEIKQATQRAVALTNQLLSFSRMQVSQPQVLNLNDSVKKMQNMLQRMVREDIRLVANLDGAGALVWADPIQIDQIIMNLAANARDAMPKGGELRYSTSNVRLKKDDLSLNLLKGEYSVLTVSDNGCGMDEVTVARIFEPFFTTKEVGKGTGLGLATVYGIIQQMHGHISVASGLGRGTTFTIYLPAARGRVDANAAKASDKSNHGTETILLVEDDSALRMLTQRILDSAGYKVYSSAGVEGAERLLAEVGAQVNLLVTDVVMPDGGGVELATRISKSYPHIKVLFMSGYTAGRIPDGYIEEGRAAFLAKPFQPSQLEKKVREVLDWKAGTLSAGASTKT